jgi:integrase
VANTTVELVWRCKTEKGWRYYPVVFGGNGRPRKGAVMVGRDERNYPEGNFYVRYYEGEQTRYRKIGTDSNKALDALRVQENALRSYAAAAKAGHEIVEDPQRRTLAKAYAAFLQAADDRGSSEARIVYRTAVDDFFKVIRGKTYLDELTAEDMLKYQRHLRAEGYADRTIHNRWANTKAFFLFCGFDSKKMPSEDGEKKRLAAPKYEEQTPEVYEPEEMERFFPAIERDPSFYACCQIMLKCGLRDQELRYLEWQNVNLKRGILHVEGNPRYGFKVKDSEQRDIPIPEKLVDWLQKYRAAHPNDRLVCPTSTGKPNTKHLLLLKRAVHRAGLNCNVCKTCDKKNECERWYLHKFRSSCVTRWLRPTSMGGAGLDLRTVMRLSGHSDLASVMRYLSPADNDIVRKSVNGIEWGD